MSTSYRPTREDYHPRETQKLSLREAGEFDKRFHANPNGRSPIDPAAAHPTVGITRIPVTLWDIRCRQRAAAGVNRRSRKAAVRSAA